MVQEEQLVDEQLPHPDEEELVVTCPFWPDDFDIKPQADISLDNSGLPHSGH
jgi:hypothetical protein